MNASLVFDGREVILPPGSNEPSVDQFQGTEYEKLCETACRECYDSYGRGRSSDALHEHVLDVINLSVTEHANPTIVFNTGDDTAPFFALMNRKGVWVKPVDTGLEVTINFRAILEWDRWTNNTNNNFMCQEMGRIFWTHGRQLAPMIFRKDEYPSGLFEQTSLKTTNLDDDQTWVSLWLYGSRGFSHEMVRHRFAMSQRSTRYVDESESPYIEHPLLTKYLNDPNVDRNIRRELADQVQRSMKSDRGTYDMIVGALVPYLTAQGLDKTNARKQARGTARGALGNALATSMIYSSNITGWRWILSQRKNRFADAEIRQVFSPGLAAVQSSQYGDRFADLRLVDSPDGLGTVLAEI